MTNIEGTEGGSNELAGIKKFENVNVNDVSQMQDILKMVKEPENMEHLAGISIDTTIDDLVKHYTDGRLGRVALGEIGDVVGVFDVSPQGPRDIKAGDRAWHILSGSLGRVCVPTEKQQKGRGTKIVEYAEEIGLRK
jgi:hypothetical protein